MTPESATRGECSRVGSTITGRRSAEVRTAMNYGALLVGQLHFYWSIHLRPRLEGLTDDEYLWAPAEPSWTVHPGPDGSIVIDQEWPEPSPPPVTTIAWRLVHIGVGCFAIRTSAFFGDGSVPGDADMFDPRHVPSDQ